MRFISRGRDFEAWPLPCGSHQINRLDYPNTRPNMFMVYVLSCRSYTFTGNIMNHMPLKRLRRKKKKRPVDHMEVGLL